MRTPCLDTFGFDIGDLLPNNLYGFLNKKWWSEWVTWLEEIQAKFEHALDCKTKQNMQALILSAREQLCTHYIFHSFLSCSWMLIRSWDGNGWGWVWGSKNMSSTHYLKLMQWSFLHDCHICVARCMHESYFSGFSCWLSLLLPTFFERCLLSLSCVTFF